jgi:hypothetical protein
MFLGSYDIDDALTFSVNTHRVDTGAAADADSAPTYRVYEDETGTPILTGTMALLDDANTLGQYSEQITLSAANGLERGKCYTIRIAATVNSVAGSTIRQFQVGAKVDVRSIGGDAQSMTDLKDFADAGYDPATNKVEGVKLADLTTDITTKTGFSLSAAGVDGVWDEVILGSYTGRQLMRGIVAALMGKLSGAATTTITIRDLGDSKDVVVATVDADGNRSAVTLDLT